MGPIRPISLISTSQAPVDHGSLRAGPRRGRREKTFDLAHGGAHLRRSYSFSLSPDGGATHNCLDNENGSQCAQSLPALVEGEKCPRKSTTCPPIGRSVPGSMTRNTRRCTPAQCRTPTGFGRNRPSASTG